MICILNQLIKPNLENKQNFRIEDSRKTQNVFEDSVKLGLHVNLLLEIEMQFSQIIAFLCAEKIASQLDCVPAKFTNRKIARLLRAFTFSAILQKLLHCQLV